MNTSTRSTARAKHGLGGFSRERYAVWLIIFCFMGYPLAGTLVALTPLPSLVASVPLRLLEIVIAVILIISVRQKPTLYLKVRRIQWNSASALLVLFWILYIGRLIWDWQVAGLSTAPFALFFVIVVGFLPALALLGSLPSGASSKEFAKIVFIIGVLTSIAALFAAKLGMAGERSLTDQVGRLATDTVNPITYGQLAATTLITALFAWHERLLPRRLIIVGVLPVLACFFHAASKGPMISLFLSILIIAVFRPVYRKLLLILCLVGIVLLLFVSDNALGQRFINIDSDMSTIERLKVMHDAFDQFQKSPVIGNAFVEENTQSYPHNPFVEAAMATGVIGAFIFTYVVIACLWRLLYILSCKKDILLAVIAFQYFMAAIISGSLYASGDLWVSLAMIISLSGTLKRNDMKTTKNVLGHDANPINAGRVLR